MVCTLWLVCMCRRVDLTDYCCFVPFEKYIFCVAGLTKVSSVIWHFKIWQITCMYNVMNFSTRFCPPQICKETFWQCRQWTVSEGDTDGHGTLGFLTSYQVQTLSGQSTVSAGTTLLNISIPTETVLHVSLEWTDCFVPSRELQPLSTESPLYSYQCPAGWPLSTQDTVSLTTQLCVC